MLGLPIRFDEPFWLVLLLLILPALVLSRRSIGGLSARKAWVTFSIRAVVIFLLSIALAHPVWEKRGEGLTVSVLIDQSQSIPLPMKSYAVAFLEQAAEAKERDEDRVAVISIAKDANITAMPDRYSRVSAEGDPGDLSATNLAAGVRLALAIMPDDTANRIILASDGNETVDSVLEAAEIARANNIPIDVLPLEFEHTDEVIFERIITRARARRGQTVDVKLVLRSTAEVSGTIRLSMNGEPLDLSGPDEPGRGLRVTLPPGPTVLSNTISLDEPGPQLFEASFDPDDPQADAIERNNSAVAVTFVGGAGKVLVIDDGVTESAYLVQALKESDIAVEVRPPDALLGGLVFLSGYDAVVLANVPRYAFDDTQDRMLRAYVHDLGGGLIMLGGAQSFGAGGWIDSEVAKALPVKLNPPQTRQMPAGALALIMHSCEMAQGNFWGQKVAQSAIEALSRLDYAGIVEYNWGGGAGGIQGCSWAFPMQRLGDKKAALDATKTMVVGDMPSFAPSMQLALQGLTGVSAAQRHAIIISDGDPSPPSAKLLQDYVDNSVTVTTVMVGGHGTPMDKARMKAVATKTGGEFYDVKNPKQLPQIFIKEAQFVSRSLIQEGDVFQPQVPNSMLPGPAQGFPRVPSITGYVLTAVRDGLAQTPILIPTEDGNDPLYAHWNYGLGKSIAYTSDLSTLWGGQWAGWARFRSFWEQSIRWAMRSASPTNMLVNTRVEGDRAIIDVEALDADAATLNFLRTSAVVLGPDASADPLTLQQVGPGRYRGEFPVDEAGAYLTNIAFETGAGDNVQRGNLQAAVTVPYPREFRAVKHNAALLEDLAARTGGRVLAADDPMLLDLFHREGLEVPLSPKPTWDLLAIIAASLLLLDVAARRLAIDPARVAALAGRAVGRRHEVSSGTVAAWKRTKAQVQAQRTPGAAAEARARRGVRFEADEQTQQQAIDVGGETDDAGADRPAPVRRKQAEAPPPDAEEGDYTSRLLAAKRRARGEGDEGDARDG
jgi:uncharacterized membrane protein